MEIPEIFRQEHSLLIVKPADFRLFAEVLAHKILMGQPKPLLPPDEERPLPQNEATKFLGKSRQTLASWRRKGIIKAYRIGGRIYYKPSELVAALQKLEKC